MKHSCFSYLFYFPLFPLFPLFALFGLLLFPSCATARQPVPEYLTPQELIQRGQEASDTNQYAKAVRFYQAVVERYPSYIDEICAAEYEIAFIHYKQKKYDLASGEFHALLRRYNTPDEELLPPQFKKLSLIVLGKIETKRKKSAKTS